MWFADPPHGKVPGKFPTQGRQEYYREASKVTEVWHLGVPAAGDIDGGSEVQGDGSICTEEAEYIRIVHLNTADSGPLQEDGAEAGGMGC